MASNVDREALVDRALSHLQLPDKQSKRLQESTRFSRPASSDPPKLNSRLFAPGTLVSTARRKLPLWLSRVFTSLRSQLSVRSDIMLRQLQLLTTEHRCKFRNIPANPVPCTCRERGQSAGPQETKSVGSPQGVSPLPVCADAARAREPDKRSTPDWSR